MRKSWFNAYLNLYRFPTPESLSTSPTLSRASDPVQNKQMSTTSAIRFLAGTKKEPLGSLRLQCHVKPGASRVREGVLAVTNDVIELCVAAQAREGEANKAVVKLLSEVSLLYLKSFLLLSVGLAMKETEGVSYE